MTDSPNVDRDGDDRVDDHVDDYVDAPDLPVLESDVNSAARSCSVILLIVVAVVAVALLALVIALING